MSPSSGQYPLALLIVARDEPGLLYRVCEVIYRYGANITYAGVVRSPEHIAEIQIEISGATNRPLLVDELTQLSQVEKVAQVPSFRAMFGKRVIVMGGGAQVGMVAQGAISEADRHNIRGERISVDTIPLVGEERLAIAVRAVPRLDRAKVLVLAGALMGGDITQAVREVRETGLIVISTNMAGSVPSAVDLVVSDPVEAGVMAVMLVADTASFSIELARGKRY